MIHEIYSSLKTFKTLRFHSGLNIILAEKSEGASQRHTRNGAGKSSIVDIVHFLTAGKCTTDKDREKSCIFRLDELKEFAFGMKFDFAGETTSVERSGEKTSKIILDPGNTSKWPIQPRVVKDSGEMELKQGEWADVLGKVMFELKSNLPKNSPTFRSIFPYFCRRRADGGFSNAQLFHKMQFLGSQQVAISFLLGLDWHVPRDLQNSRDKEKSLKILKQQAESGLLDSLIGKTGDLQSQLTVLERKAQKLNNEISNYQVLPEYDQLEKEASKIARKIADSSNLNTIDEEQIRVLQDSLRDEESPPTDDVMEVYKNAGVLLPESVTHRLDDVLKFHQAILRNRRSHLKSEISEAEIRLSDRRKHIKSIDSRRIEILETLQTHGALDQLLHLQGEYARIQSEVEEFRKKFKLAKQLEETKAELNLERAQIYQRLVRDHEEQTEVIKESIILFEELSEGLSERQGHLIINPDENGPQVEIEVPSSRSAGVQNMQIFCFDLMLIILWTRKKLGPGFLIHDSHLFDGVDSRQVANAIEFGAERAFAEGFQYIVTLNSDDLPREEFSKNFDVDKYVVPVEIDDSTETGGLFGFRF